MKRNVYLLRSKFCVCIVLFVYVWFDVTYSIQKMLSKCYFRCMMLRFYDCIVFNKHDQQQKCKKEKS